MATLTWLGHAAFRIDTDGGTRIYVDPFLQSNPKTPDSERRPERVDIIAVTHGHSDHAGEVPELSKAFPDAQIVAQVEVKGWFGKQGAPVGDLPGLNKGGSQEIDGIRFTLTERFSFLELRPGRVSRRVVRDRDALRRQVDLLRRRHLRFWRHGAASPASTSPTSPCSRSATGSRWARRRPRSRSNCSGTRAASLRTGGTFGLLTGTPDALAALTSAQVEKLEPGESIEF